MKVPLTYVIIPIAGIERYMIQEAGSRFETIPNLMRSRYYIDGRILMLDRYELPGLWNFIEYDYRLQEWFIVRRRLEYG